jgi:Putative transposase
MGDPGCARPPFSLERLTELPDGRVAYQLDEPRRGMTHRIMSPEELLGRIAALVPPPRYPLVRYQGVFAPRSSFRPLVTPRPRPRPAACCPSPTSPDTQTDATSPAPAPTVAEAIATDAGSLGPAEIELHPRFISVRHWGRLGDGELLATAPRLDWARLMRRTFGFEVLACPSCGCRMRPLAVIDDPALVTRILLHLGLPTEPPARGPPREPTWIQSQLGFAA